MKAWKIAIRQNIILIKLLNILKNVAKKNENEIDYNKIILTNAEKLGIELDELFEETIMAMRSCEDDVNGYFE